MKYKNVINIEAVQPNTKHKKLSYWNEAMLQKLSVREKMLAQELWKLEKDLEAAPSGRLKVLDKKTYYQYYFESKPGHEKPKYIPNSNIKFAESLAQRDYDKKLLKIIRAELDYISNYKEFLVQNDPKNIYEQMHPGRKAVINPFIEPDDSFIENWRLQSYTRMGFEEGLEEFYSNAGVRVRSKSEVMIANMLEYYDIPYRYEYPIVLKGVGNARPDFLCLNKRTREEFYWEHFGMMDNVGYANRNVKKINDYEQNKYYPGENMIMTFETSLHPLSSKTIKDKISKYLL